MSAVSSTLRLGAVHLRVADLEKQEDFYRRVVGLALLARHQGRAVLGVDGRPLLALDHAPGARPARGATGLFHTAFLLPSRADLGRFLNHLHDRRHPLDGASDHGVSEALYFNDAEGNGIEVYRDRRPNQWPRSREGGLAMYSRPLDLTDLAQAAEGGTWDGAPPDTILGHVHLKVNDLHEAQRFYRDVLGFELMQNFGDEAAFLSAAGYHHHLGINTWYSRNAPPPPTDATGLTRVEIALPASDLAPLQERLKEAEIAWQEEENGLLLKDPAGNNISLLLSVQSAGETTSILSSEKLFNR